MVTNNRLAIVIISYNTEQMTRECLASVYENADMDCASVIVVDNDSKDGSVEMIKAEFPDVLLIENKENTGFAAANNQAFEAVDADYFLLLNSDTIVLGDVIGRSLEYLQNHPEVGAFGCRVLNTDRTTQQTCSGFPSLPRLLLKTLGIDRLGIYGDRYLMRGWDRDDEREVDVITGCYLMTPAPVLRQVGPLDDDFFFYGEETDWCYRCKKAGYRLVFSPVGEIVHHGGGSVKKFNYRRDILLTSGLVRLHKKHSGLLAGITCYLILSVFNFSRAVGYSIPAALQVRTAQERFVHFFKVTVGLKDAWPS